ncbi:LLM class flavin-dependent oxidoreductase [Rhizorhabdus dicambivorans]|uniref:LLM class flavin-dependent oxidoreductase n=1 Tax=Rhizorhabdus dicambivorans TaxID=1850238 RepID=A0A2A4FPL0_9SPHN|nr:LLM class flavin-dependent oxidoreductase [Rhizorhabdus dicambivorans]ATE64659.1 LLM class flavin-dependent oxidoreductase [Rhizorhabdus dicambivorans]PCE39640.1 LLM class flavin-dependent oxidoreductase [Rhizorhabdus dicambivorans]
MGINPIFNDNRLKLGTFCTNGRGASHTLVPEANRLDWPLAVKLAQMVDRAGFEAVVPYARWKGYIAGKPHHVSGEVLDPYSWAAGIAQATEQIGVFVTSHAPTIHPLLAAKQTATIDIISNGRLALNVVGGWNRPELEMFGAPLKEHDQRYDHLAEWLHIIRTVWDSEEEFDHQGEFFNILRGFLLPKPIQRPGPAIMNAGLSDRGRLFACEHADLCFVGLKAEDFESVRAEVDKYKRTARERFGRKVQVWAHSFVVQRDSQKEAEDYLRYYAVTHQDREAIDAHIGGSIAEVHDMPPAVWDALRLRFAAGFGGFPLVGTAERITERLEMMSRAGLDGVLLTWVDYLDGVERFNRDVLPMLEQAGLRRAAPPRHRAGGEQEPTGSMPLAE